jgi:hypothetical protein
MKKNYPLIYLLIFLSVCFFSPQFLHAEEKPGLSKGQTIYVPAYSHIYHGDKESHFLLTVTLSIRNIDLNHKIKITAVDYYESQGKFLKNFLDKPVVLNPLASMRHIIPHKDRSGGSGANFIVKWESDKKVNPPVVESIMISTYAQQGVSFTSRGREILLSE